jgi:hypothetical protein
MSEPRQQPPGTLAAMRDKPDHGEVSYQGNGRLAGKTAVITGGEGDRPGGGDRVRPRRRRRADLLPVGGRPTRRTPPSWW